MASSASVPLIVQQCIKARLLDEVVVRHGGAARRRIRKIARGQPLRRDTDRLLLFRLGGRVAHWRCGVADLCYGEDNTCRAYLRSSWGPHRGGFGDLEGKREG